MTEIHTYPPNDRPEVHLVYASDRLPIPNQGDLQRCLSPLGAANPPSASLQWVQQDPRNILGTVRFDGHELLIAGLTVPLPREVIDQTVMVSPWQGQIKAAMRQHRAHISLIYKQGSQDPVEQMVALYKLACACADEDLLGLVNINAWTAHPVADFLSPENIASYRNQIPFNLWFGFVRFFTDDEAYWLVTKGFHLFDVPDLAYRVQPGEDPEEVIGLFINLFYYLYEEDVFVTAGDTLEVQGTDQQLVFSEVTELETVLIGPSGTLVLEKISPPA